MVSKFDRQEVKGKRNVQGDEKINKEKVFQRQITESPQIIISTQFTNRIKPIIFVYFSSNSPKSDHDKKKKKENTQKRAHHRSQLPSLRITASYLKVPNLMRYLKHCAGLHFSNAKLSGSFLDRHSYKLSKVQKKDICHWNRPTHNRPN